MARVRKLIAKLKLRVNESKSRVTPASRQSLLGYSFWYYRGEPRLRVAKKALVRMKDRVRRITRRQCGRSVERVMKELNSFLRGWRNYYALAQTGGIFRSLDGWIRRRLRALQLGHWKGVGTTYRALKKLGADSDSAWAIARNARRYWSNSAALIHHFLPTRYFDRLGLVRLTE